MPPDIDCNVLCEPSVSAKCTKGFVCETPAGYYSKTYKTLYTDGYGYNFYYRGYGYYEYSVNTKKPVLANWYPAIGIGFLVWFVVLLTSVAIKVTITNRKKNKAKESAKETEMLAVKQFK